MDAGPPTPPGVQSDAPIVSHDLPGRSNARGPSSSTQPYTTVCCAVPYEYISPSSPLMLMLVILVILVW
ncbi:hypothetical protein N7509_005574 [Penicillium cosmopolitanum]|uniref:Uncharacterized protein n=1 Tax=Penicillium cosmopolitanum TaxID=1131564 RepID=A0A9W9W2P9_9EURO|nr:uncharacterized protein N7509_005574 [Penicillium cosmopolitanum]KAJ5397461.1 hypothetical protein N7509_005574 [Penicillium cosmopolitanum]